MVWISWSKLIWGHHHWSWIERRSSLVCMSLDHKFISDEFLLLNLVLIRPYFDVWTVIIELMPRWLLRWSSQKVHLLCVLRIETRLRHAWSTLTLVYRRTTNAHLVVLLSLWTYTLDMMLVWTSSKETDPWTHHLSCINSLQCSFYLCEVNLDNRVDKCLIVAFSARLCCIMVTDLSVTSWIGTEITISILNQQPCVRQVYCFANTTLCFLLHV